MKCNQIINMKNYEIQSRDHTKGQLAKWKLVIENGIVINRLSEKGKLAINLVPRARDLQEKNRELWDNP